VKPMLLALALALLAGRAPCAERTPGDLRAFLVEWEKAQVQFINGDPSPWKVLGSRADDVTILGTFGGLADKGWAAADARYDWASSQYRKGAGGATVKVEYVSMVEADDLDYTVAMSASGGPG
jgi:hypothetical protein